MRVEWCGYGVGCMSNVVEIWTDGVGLCVVFVLMIRRPPRATPLYSSAASDVYKRQYVNNEISFNKPISCHLYPVRVKEYSEFTAVNYHNWFICSDACSLGNELKKPVYEFVKEALIKKFGNQWFLELEKIAKNKTK